MVFLLQEEMFNFHVPFQRTVNIPNCAAVVFMELIWFGILHCKCQTPASMLLSKECNDASYLIGSGMLHVT